MIALVALYVLVVDRLFAAFRVYMSRACLNMHRNNGLLGGRAHLGSQNFLGARGREDHGGQSKDEHKAKHTAHITPFPSTSINGHYNNL